MSALIPRIARSLGAGVVALLALLCAVPALAHKASDAYLLLEGGTADGTRLRVDVALRDLDVALDLDRDGDGQLTWGEVRVAWPTIESYLRERIAMPGCTLAPSGQALERRVDGVYAALSLRSDCAPVQAPAIRYGVMQEVDPTHRGIARVEWAGQGGVLRVLVPAPVGASAPAAGTASPGATDAAPASEAEQPSAWQFIHEGVRHIVTGYDHVLFLICLLLPSVLRRSAQGWQPVDRLQQALWPVVGIVTAFTLAHSITLALAATGTFTLPPSFIEPAIAVTIMLAALDNLWPIFRGRRVWVTFFFGLIHGFGFASVLAELELPTAQFAWALLQFNLGIEAGQLVIVAIITALLFTLRARSAYPPLVLRGGSVVAIGLAALWLVERVANVSILPL